MDPLQSFFQDVSIFHISGPDAERYLHGRTSQDIKSLKKDGSSKWALILTPQGKIDGLFYISRLQDDTFLLVSEISGEKARADFMAALLRFKVADQLECKDLSESHGVLSLCHIPPAFVKDVNNYGAFSSCQLTRGSMECLDLVYDRTMRSDLEKAFPEFIDQQQYEFLRINAGHPLAGKDITESIFAPDIPSADYVSFGKGCYAGQEVVEMAKARGKANRVFIQIRMDTQVMEQGPFNIYSMDSSEKLKVGFVTSLVTLPDDVGSIGLAFLKNSALEKYNPASSSLFIGSDQSSIPAMIPVRAIKAYGVS